MVLISLAFAMTASLARNFSEVSGHLSGKQNSQQGQLIVLGVAGELDEAFEISVPPVGSSSAVTEVRMKKYASTPARLTSSTNSSSWSPGYVLSIRYYQDSENLLREVTYPDASVRTSVISEGIQGFSATRLNQRSLEVRASFIESKKLKTVAAFSYGWGE